jgi:hypothetical protein
MFFEQPVVAQYLIKSKDNAGEVAARHAAEIA